MTTQDIIKSLRTCAGHPGCTGCDCQAGYVNEQESCIDWLMRLAADELEELREALEYARQLMLLAACEPERLNMENERMAEDIAKFAGRDVYGE